MRLPRPCITRGCPRSTYRSRCDACERLFWQMDRAMRGSASDRGYNAEWRAATAGYLVLHPWCARCQREGRRTRSAVVGHVKALRHGGARLDPRNWEALCNGCNAKQSHEDKAAQRA